MTHLFSLWSFPILAIIQKRLKKEKKAKRKLQEALEYESKRREQAEQTLKQPSPSDSMRSLNGQMLHSETISYNNANKIAHLYSVLSWALHL